MVILSSLIKLIFSSLWFEVYTAAVQSECLQQCTMSQGSDTDGGVVSPIVVQFRDVTAAAYRIKKGVKETPLEV